MTTAKFIDFSQAELRNIVQDHNLHLMIKNYSKLTKLELVKLIETMLFIDSNNRIKIMPKILSKYNEYFKDIEPGYIVVKRNFKKKSPKKQPKQKLPAIPTIPESYSKEIEKHKKNIEKLTKPIFKDAHEEAHELLLEHYSKNYNLTKNQVIEVLELRDKETEGQEWQPLHKVEFEYYLKEIEKRNKPKPKMLKNNEIEIKLTLEQIAKIIRSVKRRQPALEDRMMSILNRMADGQTKFGSFNEYIIKEMIDYL